MALANEENLKKGEPYRFRSGEHAVKNGIKGGKASGEARRRKKAMRDAVIMMLDMDLPAGAKELRMKLKAMGVKEEDLTYQTAIMVGIVNQAMKGNTKAAAFLRDTAGENPSLELRKRELEQRSAEFEYKKMADDEARKKEENTSTLADAIEEAYQKRMEADGNVEQ